MKTRHILIFLGLFIAAASFASAQSEVPVSMETQPTELSDNSPHVPEGCVAQGFTFQNGQLILGTGNGLFNQQIYMLRNNSDYEQLLLSHPTNTAMSAGWESRLDQGQWSALAMNQSNFIINCFGRKPGAIGYVACNSVLEVCAYSKAGMSGEGSYWLSENQSLFDTLSALKSRNVTIPK